jgi:hypothetical protein
MKKTIYLVTSLFVWTQQTQVAAGGLSRAIGEAQMVAWSSQVPMATPPLNVGSSDHVTPLMYYQVLEHLGRSGQANLDLVLLFYSSTCSLSCINFSLIVLF